MDSSAKNKPVIFNVVYIVQIRMRWIQLKVMKTCGAAKRTWQKSAAAESAKTLGSIPGCTAQICDVDGTWIGKSET